jgi:hypothetical protein
MKKRCCINNINDTGGKFAASVNCTPAVSMTPVANLATDTTGDVDTSGKLAAGVNATNGK